MSSHHVIRDEQEPPVIILDDNFKLSVLEELLGWAPLLIISVDLLKWFQARKIKVDGVLIDTTKTESFEIDPGLISYHYESNLLVEVLHSIAEEKDFTGLNIFCNQNLKNQLISQVEHGEYFKEPINIFTDNEKTIISPQKTFKKWYPKGQKILFDHNRIKAQPDLFKKIDDHFITIEEGVYQFESEQPPFIITEY